MKQEWQQVSRRRRAKPRRGSSHPRADSFKGFKGSSNVSEEAVEPVPEVSAEKRTQIIRRVRGIADVLRDSLLLKDALRVVTEQFDRSAPKKSTGEEKKEEEDAGVGTDDRPTLVGYGLGSFCASSNAVHQLGFHVALAEALKLGKATETEDSDEIQHRAELFDPAMNKSDVGIAEHFKLKIIQENEHGRRRVARNTVFFMPHCGKALYQNVLACNWGSDAKKLIIIGNSFSAYGDRVLASKEREQLVLVRVLPYLVEVALPCGVPKNHEDFTRYEAAFNDLSVHRFPAELLDRALLDDTNLSDQMAAVASATGLSPTELKPTPPSIELSS